MLSVFDGQRQLQLLCATLLACNFRAKCAAVGPLDLLFESLPNFSDEVLEPKFQVAVSKRGIQQNETEHFAGHTSVTLKAPGGSEFTCYQPQAETALSTKEEGEPTPEKLPSGLLDGLTDGCLYRLEDWWSYEVCYHKQIRQYHRQGDVTTSEFVLGVFSGNLSEADEIMHEEGPAVLARAYVRESYTGGTDCDVADRPRSAELRYTCARDDKTAIISVKELHSCSYQIVLATPLICAHPAFKGKEVPVQEISCFRSDDGSVLGSMEMLGTSTDMEDDAVSTDEEAEDLIEESDLGGTDQVVTLQMDDLDEASLDELVRSLIHMGIGEDPDRDFLEAAEEEEEADHKEPNDRQYGAPDEL